MSWLLVARAAVAELANEAGHACRARPPVVLSASSSRTDVVRWMQWNDPNGCHTDDRARAEDFDPYTEETAWDALAEMIKES